MKKLGMAIALAAAGGMLVAAPAGAENLSFYNSTSNWEAALADELGGTWTCEKTEVDYYMGSVTSSADVVIVKGGNGFIVYLGGGSNLEAPQAGKSGQAAGVSWYMECYSDGYYYG